MADPTTNPYGEITIGGRMQGKNLTRPGVYINTSGPSIAPSPAFPIGTVTSYVDSSVTANGGSPYPVIMTPKGWAAVNVSNAPLSAYSVTGLEDMMKEIEGLFELADQIDLSGVTSLEEKAAEYNKFEEELIRRLDDNPPLTIDTRKGSVYDTMMKFYVEEAKRTAEQIKDNLNGT